jgi:hypothetical protein
VCLNELSAIEGVALLAKILETIVKSMNIKVNYNATATPRANGQAERYNRTILSTLSISTDDERNWDMNVQTVQWGLNTSINKTTGKTPYELLLGYQPRQANDTFLSAEVCETSHNKDIFHTREQTCTRIKRKQDEQKARYDRKRKMTTNYCVGQLVLVRKIASTNDCKSKKLLQKI